MRLNVCRCVSLANKMKKKKNIGFEIVALNICELLVIQNRYKVFGVCSQLTHTHSVLLTIKKNYVNVSYALITQNKIYRNRNRTTHTHAIHTTILIPAQSTKQRNAYCIYATLFRLKCTHSHHSLRIIFSCFPFIKNQFEIIQEGKILVE